MSLRVDAYIYATRDYRGDFATESFHYCFYFLNKPIFVINASPPPQHGGHMLMSSHMSFEASL